LKNIWTTCNYAQTDNPKGCCFFLVIDNILKHQADNAVVNIQLQRHDATAIIQVINRGS